MNREFAHAVSSRGTPKKRARTQRAARAITYSLPKYRDDRTISSWPSPGRGVSGETSN